MLPDSMSELEQIHLIQILIIFNYLSLLLRIITSLVGKSLNIADINPFMQYSRTKKLSLFRATRRKRVQDIMTQLSERDLSQKKLRIEELIQQRKRKLKQIRQLKSTQISQPHLQPTKIMYSQFSYVSPVSSQQKFLPEKVRHSLIVPDRAFSSEVNVLGGAIKKVPTQSPFIDKQVLSRKFQEYNNAVNSQSGMHKRKLLQLKKLNEIKYHSISVKQDNKKPTQNYNTICESESNAICLKVKKNKDKISKIAMKKTFFQKFQPDKYRFYPQHLSSLKLGSIFQLTSLRKSSANQRQQLLKSAAKSRTIELINSTALSRNRRSQQDLQYLYSDRKK